MRIAAVIARCSSPFFQLSGKTALLPAVSPEPTRRSRKILRLIIACMVLMLGAMWCAIAYFVTESKSARLAEEQRVLAHKAQAVREQTHSLFSLIDYFLGAADLWFQKHPDADPLSDPQFRVLTQRFREKTRGMVDIRFVSTPGELYYLGTPRNKPLARVADRDYYLAQMQPESRGLFIGKPVLSRVTNQWGLPVSYPLKSRPGQMAVIFAAIENHALEQPFETLRTKPSGCILLAHRDGTIIFRSPDDHLIGKSVSNTGFWKHKLPLAAEDVFAMETPANDDIARVGAYATISGYPLVVVATSVIDEVLSEWREKTRGLILFGSMTTLAAGLILWRLRASLRLLDDDRRKLEEQANIDALTQIANQRYFMTRGALELGRTARYTHPLSLLLYDIDHLKRINDRYGHDVGDRVLMHVAAAIQEELRTTDFQGRFGGEEFAVLLPETAPAEAVEVAERLRQRIENSRFPPPGDEEIRLSISVGVTSFKNATENLDQLLARADHALYEAKATGRNRVCTDFND